MSDGILARAALDHVGIAAAAASELPLRTLLGGGTGARAMPSGVVIERFGVDGRLELVVPGRAGTPIDRFLATRGPGLHHVALVVDDPLESLLPRLRAAGIEAAGGIEPSSDGRPSLFLHPASTGGILVELVNGPMPS